MLDTSNLINDVRTMMGVMKGIKDGKVTITADTTFGNNIVTLNKMFMVRPRLIISDKLKYMDQSTLKATIDANLKIFISNYIQAFKILTNVYGLDSKEVLHKLNNQSAGSVLFKGIGKVAGIGYESEVDLYRELLDNNDKPFVTNGYEGKNDLSFKNTDDNIKLNQMFITNYELEMTVSNGTDAEGKPKKTIVKTPITIYPDIRFTDSVTLLNNLVEGNEASFFSRLDDYKSGAITLSDLIFAGDLVEKYKKNQIKNENDIVKYLRGINKINTINSAITGSKNYSVNYNMYILDTADKLTIEELVQGKIISEKYKTIMLDQMLAFSISFVDMDKEAVTIYINGIPSFSVLNFNMLKKDKDADVNDIFKKLLTNKSPF